MRGGPYDKPPGPYQRDVIVCSLCDRRVGKPCWATHVRDCVSASSAFAVEPRWLGLDHNRAPVQFVAQGLPVALRADMKIVGDKLKQCYLRMGQAFVPDPHISGACYTCGWSSFDDAWMGPAGCSVGALFLCTAFIDPLFETKALTDAAQFMTNVGMERILASSCRIPVIWPKAGVRSCSGVRITSIPSGRPPVSRAWSTCHRP